jgi:hypothetical protein
MTSRLIIGVGAGVLGLMIAATVGAAKLNGSWKGTYEAVCLKRSRLSFRVEIRGRAVPYRGRTVRVTALHLLTGMSQDGSSISADWPQSPWRFSPTFIARKGNTHCCLARPC